MNEIKISKYKHIHILRDDILKGGTKSRFVDKILDPGAGGYVYCSPRCGGFQIALANTTLESPVFIFTPKSIKLHINTQQAKKAGAIIKEIPFGRQVVLEKKARDFILEHKSEKYQLVKWGGHVPIAIESISKIMKKCIKKLKGEPDEIWCAVGSGTLISGILKGTSKSKIYGVQVGKSINFTHPRMEILKYHKPFNLESKMVINFQSNPNYDLKALEYCLKFSQKNKKIFFWNVM